MVWLEPTSEPKAERLALADCDGELGVFGGINFLSPNAAELRVRARGHSHPIRPQRISFSEEKGG